MKKIISVILVLILLFSVAISASATTVKYGDVNADGVVNGKDAGQLMQYVNGWDVEGFVVSAADVNVDGKINNKDCILLMRYINGWDVVLGDNEEQAYDNPGPLVYF